MNLIIIATVLLNVAQSVIVNTSIGHIEGTSGIDVNTFFGIPFAKPPINELRFQSPQPITDLIGNETNPFQANVPFENVTACIQASLSPEFSPNYISEDCLYLNIFAPSDAEYMKTNYTVMVWIYGGGYSIGYIALYDATEFVGFIGDIIIVTINYRLGALGFLYDNMFDTDVTGNYGYQDQKLGIKWVYDNIRYFGGNPDNVNIFGESAGGGSVSLQLLYNKDGYIKSGIMQSPWNGPAFPYKTPTTWEDTISQFNALTNCTQYESDSDELLNCWRGLDAEKVLEAQNILTFAAGAFFFFIPTVETTELLYQPLWAFTNGEIDDIPPYIIGTNKDEYGTGGYIFQSYEQGLETVANDIAEGDLEIAASIFRYYNITESNIVSGADYGIIGSDYWRCSVRYMLDLLGDNTDNIYTYDFAIVDPPLYKLAFPTQPSCWNISCHGADLSYFFVWADVEYENDSIAVAQDLQILWSNFAKTLNPNDDGSGEGRIDLWPQYTNKNGVNNYIQFTFDAFNSKSTDSDEYVDICPFWNKVGYAGNYSNPYNDTISTVIINTTIGFIEGFVHDDVNVFLNIPYAKPPVDELRFASPEPITESIGDEANPFQAIEFDQIACMQVTNSLFPGYTSMSEDCLYLSIVTPADAEYMTTNYTVMVWIHGGAYVVGTGLDVDPSNFVSYVGDVIMVMINYRLGALGFLYDAAFDTGVTGNFGYEDQKLAIKWVHDNIQYFGGNPDNINIFGVSAGGGSVSLQLLYNRDGYIKSGIMQSPWSGPYTAYPTPASWSDTISQFNALTNCTEYESDSDQLLNCWRNVDANKILLAQSTIEAVITTTGIFIPTVETTELLYQPLWGFTNGEIEDIPPYIIGTVDAEGYVILEDFTTMNNSYQGLLTSVYHTVNDFEIAASILDYYGITETESPSSSYILDNAQIQSDAWRCSVRYLLKLLGDNTDNIYNYDFDVVDYELNKNVFLPFIPSCWNVSCHGIDMPYLFDNDIYYQFDEYNDENIAITKKMQTLWSNFAKYLNPNGNDDTDTTWPPYTNLEDVPNYLEFKGYNEYKKKSIFDDDRTDICSFWDKVGYSGMYSNPDEIVTTSTTMSTTPDNDSKATPYFVFGCSIFIFFYTIVL